MKYTAAMMVLLAAPLVSAPPPTLLREIDLNKVIPARPEFLLATQFAFSPDEKWIAVALTARAADPRIRLRDPNAGSARLLLVRLDGTAEQIIQIQSDFLPFGNPGWSPDSGAVFVEGVTLGQRNSYKHGIVKLWDVKGNELLRRDGPGFTGEGPAGGVFGFLDPEHLLARRIPARGAASAFEIVNLRGQTVDTWSVPKHWRVVDISPEQGRLAVLTDRASKTLVVDYATRKVVLSKDNPHGDVGDDGGPWQFFTEGGKTLCSVGSDGLANPQFNVDTECWDVDSGKKIAQFNGFRGGAPAAASSAGSRLVLTSDIAFPKRGAGLLFPGGERAVWDFRSGDVIAAWDAPQNGRNWANPINGPVALSSSGRYVAEWARSVLRIYELP